MKSRLYWALGAVALAGASYAVLHDPQPTTHNGLVRVPTGDADIDATNALEDAENAYELHEEARMNGEYDKARFYQEAAEAAISIGNRASAEATSDLLKEYNSGSTQATKEPDTVNQAVEDAVDQAVDDAIAAVGSSSSSTIVSPDTRKLSNLRNIAESLEWSCKNYGTNCDAAALTRRQYEDALAGR